ncbi:2-oxoglutarate dehydrogenase E1 component [Salegentibacter echinorum]|uniref:oxoglutarate dehydrogenase (succinyl-transferring) n=1 Tax=Salegentibacter echinorum TaxID=1073325 RepID=A0A1M5EN22_SALEC|nr:2-oxoglutarate dehydrogenase E1 component [Salegentibacter echinorum]SHF80534.1 2-oxoglutarate dehydrogenase E1 component [Salegentibacter echinorum]
MDKFSFLNAAHTAYFAELYDQYLQYPDSVEPSWRAFFQGFDFGMEESGVTREIIEEAPVKFEEGDIPEHVLKEFQVIRLIDGYRSRGHLFTKTNPVRERRKYQPTLALENFGLEQSDLDTKFNAGEVLGLGSSTLKEIVNHLENIYCESTGVEYMFIRKPEEVEWIQNWLGENERHGDFSTEDKKKILKKLNQAVSFEAFLHRKYVGQKRFSLEGGESLIPALDVLIERASDYGVRDFVMGMAHRGRLNTLTNIFGKSAKDIFSEFDGKDYEQDIFDGDVKYHLGWTSCRLTDNGKGININLAPNPSHLETVGPVVQGISRAKQDRHYGGDNMKVLPILVHGDAAIAGQGVVYEVVQMAQLEGYETGGTIHIVVNNQIGFTTNYLDARSSTYCTDIGKVTKSPVMHVNADDVEAVVHAVNFALDFRMKFKRDVFIDLLGYRKYGHNEGDEPKFTQPKLYRAIAKHKNARDIYAEKLIAANVIDDDYLNKLEEEYKADLEENLEDSKKVKTTRITPFMQDEWEGFENVFQDEMMKGIDTTYNMDDLDLVAKAISKLPEDKTFMRKVKKIIELRKKQYFEDDKLDWAMGEHLAYGSLLKEGFNVRISGQDSERGTFSHRHALVKVEDSEEEIILHNNIEGRDGDFFVYNSPLSEYGVMGFDYGYAMASPKTLTIWEAQFGDFVNGAQILIDQYLSAAEDKWKLQNGLVLFLPHGYEGQGAEHSSGRMERFLQLCAKDNLYVADVTTPANMFHLLRRQMKLGFRKPLVIFTPKSLLRNSNVISTKEEFANGSFQTLLDDPEAKVKKVKSLVFCTGKFYYDLLEYKKENDRDDVALVRIEQLFPLPKDRINEIIKKYKNAKDVVWAQEEPRNMGAYGYLLLHLEQARDFRVCSRKFYGSPAAGSTVRFKKRHEKVIASVFDQSIDN